MCSLSTDTKAKQHNNNNNTVCLLPIPQHPSMMAFSVEMFAQQ